MFPILNFLSFFVAKDFFITDVIFPVEESGPPQNTNILLATFKNHLI